MKNDLIYREDLYNSFVLDDTGEPWLMADILYRIREFPTAKETEEFWTGQYQDIDGDFISRQDVLSILENIATEVDEGYGFNYPEWKVQVLELPSAQPELKCNSCRYNHLEWYEEPCDSCTMGGETNHYKPSAQPEQRWVPCSERLPDKYGKYLVTFIPSGGTLWTYVTIAHYSDLMGIAKPCFHVGNPGKNDFQNITKQVSAWMPLPEPYKDGDAE